MEERTEIVARGVRVFVRAAIAGAALAIVGGVSFAAPNSQPFAARVAAPAPAPALLVAKRAAPAADCGETPDGFTAWLQGFKQEAEIDGVPPAVIESALSNVAYDPDVIAHDRRQGSFGLDFDKFVAKRVSAYRVRKGRQMLLAYAEPLDKIERRFGVPGPVLVAIWGLETEFGAGLGNYPTFNALATLAYDCRRADQFREELVDALKLVARGDMQPEEMRGAWAGEIGQTQFMPSTYLKYATSADGGAIANLVGNSEDALASTANFLKNKGWRRGQGFHEGEPNFAALLEWNAAPVYAKTIAYFADRLAEPDAQ
ncbi:MAG: lytic murein transglycosylase [Roseiarcus sp.]|jgi:lytic murein transglycosylase